MNKAVEGKETAGARGEFGAEVGAIKTVLEALDPLDAEARARVLEYVVKRLQVALPSSHHKAHSATPHTPPPTVEVAPSVETGSGSVVHLKHFKEEKKPRSANEMAALVAYYLANMAQDRRATINTKDIETQFKIAEFPLPEQVKMTLPNAKAAGYFDAAGGGEYRLNAVGHNLVVHSMPRGSGEQRKKRKGARNGKSQRKR